MPKKKKKKKPSRESIESHSLFGKKNKKLGERG
jgi:hypothetical protein